MDAPRPSRTPQVSRRGRPCQECEICGNFIKEKVEYQTDQLATILRSACVTQDRLSNERDQMEKTSPQVMSHDHYPRDYSQCLAEGQHAYVDLSDGHLKSITAWSPQFAFQSTFATNPASLKSPEPLSASDVWIPNQSNGYTELNNDGLSYFSLNVMLANASTSPPINISTAPASPYSNRGAVSETSTHDQAPFMDPGNTVLPGVRMTHVRDQTLAFVGAQFNDFEDEGFADS